MKSEVPHAMELEILVELVEGGDLELSAQNAPLSTQRQPAIKS